MTTTFNRDSVDNEDIRQLRAAAESQGDHEQVRLCDAALEGDCDAAEACLDAIEAQSEPCITHHCSKPLISDDLARGIASYHRTWDRFNGLTVSAQCGRISTDRQVGTFDAGECQPTITTAAGLRYAIRDLGSMRVEQSAGIATPSLCLPV